MVSNRNGVLIVIVGVRLLEKRYDQNALLTLSPCKLQVGITTITGLFGLAYGE